MLMQVKGLHSGYGKVPILHDVSFHIDERETVAVIGPNGAGKSTLLKTIAGLVKLTSGELYFDGHNITGTSPDQLVRLGIALVPEGGRPFANMSVIDNLRMGAYSKREVLKTGVLDELFEIFPRLKERAKQMARTLSGGERQMLAIARGLVSRPKMIMLDEPSLGLAPNLVDEIYEKICALRNELGLTVLLIEQNTNYALELASRCYVLENGRIVMEGSSAEMSGSEHIKKHYLGL
ncbi:MAG: ABC transporter ATP-binding protein [Anaerolineae bacterium]|nr:ABC transporter ATP-binding protein [Anaerolineae bacterium]